MARDRWDHVPEGTYTSASLYFFFFYYSLNNFMSLESTGPDWSAAQETRDQFTEADDLESGGKYK